MKKIWKFPLTIEDEQFVQMPAGAEILCVQPQASPTGWGLFLWALVDPNAPRTERRIFIRGTGREVQETLGRYVGTFQQLGGALVRHVFDSVQPGRPATDEDFLASYDRVRKRVQAGDTRDIEAYAESLRREK